MPQARRFMDLLSICSYPCWQDEWKVSTLAILCQFDISSTCSGWGRSYPACAAVSPHPRVSWRLSGLFMLATFFGGWCAPSMKISFWFWRPIKENRISFQTTSDCDLAVGSLITKRLYLPEWSSRGCNSHVMVSCWIGSPSIAGGWSLSGTGWGRSPDTEVSIDRGWQLSTNCPNCAWTSD